MTPLRHFSSFTMRSAARAEQQQRLHHIQYHHAAVKIGLVAPNGRYAHTVPSVSSFRRARRRLRVVHYDSCRHQCR